MILNGLMINMGHFGGDKILKEITNILLKSIRPDDFLARIGGDEFAIILNRINKIEDTGIVAEKILSHFDNSIDIPELKSIDLSISIGISCYAPATENFNAIFKQADIALYKAKYTGKKHFEFYSKLIRDLYLEKKDIVYELKKALENREYALLYQPIINIKNGKIQGLETLIRWKNENLGNIPPSKFIPIAEETGIITRYRKMGRK